LIVLCCFLVFGQVVAVMVSLNGRIHDWRVFSRKMQVYKVRSSQNITIQGIFCLIKWISWWKCSWIGTQVSGLVEMAQSEWSSQDLFIIRPCSSTTINTLRLI
jgi:hypothetical protein